MSLFKFLNTLITVRFYAMQFDSLTAFLHKLQTHLPYYIGKSVAPSQKRLTRLHFIFFDLVFHTSKQGNLLHERPCSRPSVHNRVWESGIGGQTRRKPCGW